MASNDRQSSDRERGPAEIFETPITRRRLLQSAAATGLVLGPAGLLAACGGDDDAGGEGAAPATTGATEEGPTRGGRLRVGHVGAGKGESFNPARGSSFIDASRYYNLFDPLSRVGPTLEIEPGLALEWNPNADSTVWEVKLRPDVTWHDGKPFTADDVIYTFGQMGDAKHVSHASVVNINLRDVKKIDDLTLEIPLKSPNARLYDSFVQQNTVIVQDGATDFSKPVGTGAFVFESFTVGERSLCTRNPNYWDEGKPYVDEWEDISIDDNAARLNALLAGEIDMMSQLPFAQAKEQRGPGRDPGDRGRQPGHPGLHHGGRHRPVRRSARPPGLPAHPRPPGAHRRRALRLRHARQRPGRQGPSLLRRGPPAAGAGPRAGEVAARARPAKRTSPVTLHTSDIVPGFVEAATLFAEQAKGAGVTVEVKKEPAERVLRHVAALHEARLRAVLLDVLVASDLVRAGAPLRRGLERDALARAELRQAHPPGAGRPGRGDRDGPLAPGPADPVRRGRLHRVDEPEPHRRRRQPGEGHRAELVLQPRRLELPGRLPRCLIGN